MAASSCCLASVSMPVLSSIISRIEASSKASEVASKDIIQPIIETVRDMIQGSTQKQIDSLSANIVQRSAARLEETLKDMPEETRHEVRDVLNAEVSAFLGTLKQQIATTPSISHVETPEPRAGTTATQFASLPGTPTYDWMPFIRRIRDMETHNRFLSVRMLREKAFPGDPSTQEALQIAIDKGLLSTYYVDNPKKPRFPTKACKLNRDDPVVRTVLGAIGEA